MSTIKPFNHNYFVGYVNEVTPQWIKIHFPSSNLLSKFCHDGHYYMGGNVGAFVVIEGDNYGFLARIIETVLPDSERKEMNESAITHDETSFHPSGKAEILLSFNVFEPEKTSKTVSNYPTIGAKVYACSDEQISLYVSAFGKKENEDEFVYAELGKLTSNHAVCNVSLNSLFGRHCGIVGTTGGGKSWTVATLIESVTKNSSAKMILIDATGEYEEVCNTGQSISIGDGSYIFHYSQLTIDELYFLLKPSSKAQVPKLMEAIRSLKIVKLLSVQGNNDQVIVDTDGILQKAGNLKRHFEEFYRKNSKDIEDKYCNFIFKNLSSQITAECVWDTNYNSGTDKWGQRNETDLSNCTSLIARINNLLCMDEYNKIFGFKNEFNQESTKDIKQVIDTHIKTGSGVLRLDFSNVSFDLQVREILVNSIGKHLLNEARNGEFKENPVIVLIDEAHQFINKSIKDEYFDARPLDSFELISKESRKYGLFLCLATQMPRDIPIGTLSQMGTFIVHRLINEQDKKAIESACSSANRSVLSFLPILGEGEALLVGVDFPMPLLLKINEPDNKPLSNTPKLKRKNENSVN